jgi:hypothetical protein
MHFPKVAAKDTSKARRRHRVSMGGRQYERLGGLADELVRLRASAIVAISPQRTSSQSGHVIHSDCFLTSGDPVRSACFRASIAPQQFDGRQLHVVAMAAKRSDLLTKLAPKAGIIASW